MKKGLDTLIVILLALGLIGIILGVSIGLYRNDMLARIQAVEALDEGNAAQDFEENPVDAGGRGNPDIGSGMDDLDALLLYGDLHTKFLAAGTLLTVSSVALFLILIRKNKG